MNFDVAIVGGGVAGCYCAYRLSAARPNARIALIESTARLGGRLESKFLPGVDIPAELGGAFVSDFHRNTFGLVQALGLALTPVSWSRRFSFIRARRLTDRSYRSEPHAVPYAFAAEERGRAPSDILRRALQTLVPRFASLWPLDRASGSRDATAHYLQELRFDGRRLDDWGFGALLREVVSGEAYQSFLAAFGSAANFGEASAYDAIRTLMSEMAPQKPYVLGGGFQQLPIELARRSKAEVRTSKHVSRIGAADDGHVQLVMGSKSDQETITANQAILALPADALQRIGLDLAPAAASAFRAELAKVTPVNACKLFLAFERPWWPAAQYASPGIGIAASYTDLPMQQCYYHSTQGEGRALLLAVFADDAAASFWAPLSTNDEDSVASSTMIEAVLGQLRTMHPDADIPDPVAAAARAWRGAWHAWRPGAQSWRSAPSLRDPHFGMPVYVCGEAYSAQQGWVEGALNSAENLLQEQFDLDPPPWVEGDYNLH
ncbi:MAG: flavin monoamine oxidase family protein [Caulobacteraceae bacterium]